MLSTSTKLVAHTEVAYFMTSTALVPYEPPVPGMVTLDQVVIALKELVDSPPSEIALFLAVLNGHLQHSRKSGYVPQHITHELVVRIMSILITKSGRRIYAVTLLNQLLLNRDRGEQGLDCRDWTVYGDQSIAVFIALDQRRT